jgi:hypothetical protein
MQRNTKALARNHSCREKAISITYFYACVRVGAQAPRLMRARVALLVQHGKRMRCLVICGLFGSTTFFLSLPHKGHDFR